MPQTDVTARVAVLESQVAVLEEDTDADHKRITAVENAVIAINGKLDNISEKFDTMAAAITKRDDDAEKRLRSLEDWRTTVVAKLAVILSIAALASSVGTALAIKWLSGAVARSSAAPHPPRAVADHCTPESGWPCDP